MVSVRGDRSLSAARFASATGVKLEIDVETSAGVPHDACGFAQCQRQNARALSNGRERQFGRERGEIPSNDARQLALVVGNVTGLVKGIIDQTERKKERVGLMTIRKSPLGMALTNLTQVSGTVASLKRPCV